MTGATAMYDPHFIETLDSSFSAVSKPILQVNTRWNWRDLQDLHAFAPLGPQYFSQKSSKHFDILTAKFAKISFVLLSLVVFPPILIDFETISNFLRTSQITQRFFTFR